MMGSVIAALLVGAVCLLLIVSLVSLSPGLSHVLVVLHARVLSPLTLPLRWASPAFAAASRCCCSVLRRRWPGCYGSGPYDLSHPSKFSVAGASDFNVRASLFLSFSRSSFILCVSLLPLLASPLFAAL